MKSLSTSLALILAGSALGDPAVGDFRLFEKTEHLPEMGAIQRTLLFCQGREFGFLRPAGWSLVPDAPAKQLTLRSRNYGVTLVLKLRFDSGRRAPPSSEALLEHAQKLFPEAKLTERFPCYANSLRGQAFDFRETIENRVAVCHRVALVPFDGGMAEFTLTSTAAQAKEAREAWGGFLTSFTCEGPTPAAKPPKPD